MGKKCVVRGAVLSQVGPVEVAGAETAWANGAEPAGVCVVVREGVMCVGVTLAGVEAEECTSPTLHRNTTEIHHQPSLLPQIHQPSPPLPLQ